MHDRLVGLLEKADLAVGSSATVVEPARLDELVSLIKGVRTRLTYPEEVLVVALAGGTGSGKSSLFNAMTGEDLVDTGGMRPTTSHPSAAVPVAIASSADGYLDTLGIDSRYSYVGPPLCLVDLPDIDSVEVEHWHRVNALLPLIDVVVWVLDPEKYRDARLHHDYLEALSDYQGQFVFVLNQIDRLAPTDVPTVVEDLTAALRSDGIEQPTVVPVSAAPVAGPPIGLEDLFLELERLRSDPATLYSKLLADIAKAASMLEEEVGGPVDFDARAARTVEAATEALLSGERVLATSMIVDFLDSIAGSLDGESRAKTERVAAETPSHIDRIATEVPPAVTPKRWFARSAPPDAPDPEEISRLIAQATIRPVRAVLAKRAVAIAAIVELGLEVQSLGIETSR